MRRLRSMVLGLALGLVLLAGLVVAPTGPEPVRLVPAAREVPVETLTVWHWNVAGNAMHGGSTTDGMVDAALASIVASDADLVSLNELCRQQYEALVEGLRAAGWPEDPADFARFEATVSDGPGSCGGQGFGLALMSRRPLGVAQRTVLPADGHQPRALLCAGLEGRSRIDFCTTHIGIVGEPDPVSGVPRNVAQLDAVLAELGVRHAAGRTVLLAGDLNAQPQYRRLDGWYAPSADTPANGNNRGAYRDLDDADPANCPGYGEWTAYGPAGAEPPCRDGATTCPASAGGSCAKIDHVIVREDRIAGPYAGDALDAPATCATEATSRTPAGLCSDHRILRGTVNVTG